MEQGAYVYIMTNKYNTVLYTGMTSDLYARVVEHKEKRNMDSFTARYNCNKLVYYKSYEDRDLAIDAERKIKNQKRNWKIKVISKFNPEWLDLTEQIKEF